MTDLPYIPSAALTRFVDSDTRTVAVDGARVAYRELNKEKRGIPLIGLTHLGGNLDSWDPEFVDLVAQERRVILLSYRGVGDSTGTTHSHIEYMASDAIAAIKSLELTRVDLLGLSMGGMVAQEILRQEPDLVDRVILAGTGPKGGPGLTLLTQVMIRSAMRGLITMTHPTSLLFFTRTRSGKQAAKKYHIRLKQRRINRDRSVSLRVVNQQLKAVHRWGLRQTEKQESSTRALVIHGNDDRMVHRDNAAALASIFSHSETHIFEDSAHGVIPQNRRAAASLINTFLQRSPQTRTARSLQGK